MTAAPRIFISYRTADGVDKATALARELDLPYVAICVVVNHAAGRGDSADVVSMGGIAQVLESAMDKVRTLLDHVVPLAPEPGP